MNLFDVNGDITYLLQTLGKTISINGTDALAIVQIITKSSLDFLKIITKSSIKRGDIITYNNNSYLVTTEVTNKKYDCIYKCEARHMPDTIKFKFGDNVKVFPCFCDAKVFDITTGKYFNTESGQMDITMQSNGDTSQIAIQQRFIKFGDVWEITGKNATEHGLLCLSCKVSTFNSNDDIVNEIAANANNYVLSVSPTSASIEVGKTAQINASVTNNGTVVNSPSFTYSSSDTSIATVNSTGLVTGIKAGSATIAVSFNGADSKTLTKTIATTVSVPQPTKLNLAVKGSTTLTINSTNTYNLVNKDTNLAPVGNFTWSLTHNPTYASITSQTNTSCVIKGLTAGIITITVTDGVNSASLSVTVSSGGGW